MDLRVRKPDGWATISFGDDAETVTVATGKTDGLLSFTLIGMPSGVPNEIVRNVLDVDPDDEEKLSRELPRTDDGTSMPLDQLRPGG